MKLTQERRLSIPVDLIRIVAIIGVIVLHSATDGTAFDPQEPFAVWRWWFVDFYQSIGRIGVPLFAMLSGALLLQPYKNEPIGVFFKKRWARIGLPFLFWGAVYFAWTFFTDPEAFTPSYIIQGVLSGPYWHFWYLYMLVGVYLFTPLLRVMVAHADRKLIKYLLIVWLLGTVLTPIPSIFSSNQLSGYVFIIPMWAGYFVLGLYLLDAKVRRSTLLACLLLGLASTVVGTYFMAATFGGPLTFFFHEYSSPTLILAAVSLFVLFNAFQDPPNETETSHPKISWLLRKISENTLPLYLLHVMIIESLQRGYFGFIISGTVMNSIYEVPLLSAVTLIICLAVIIPLKKIPLLKRLIG